MENDINKLRQNKLFISTPMYGGKVSGICMQSLCQLYALLEKLEIPFVHHSLYGESMVTRARTISAEMFMRSDATHLLFVDADIGFQAGNVLELLAWQTADSPYDILGGAYLKKIVLWEKIAKAVKEGMAEDAQGGPTNLVNHMSNWVCTALPEGYDQEAINKKQPLEILEVGCGFTMIRRSTFQLFKDTYPEYTWIADKLIGRGNAHMTFYFHSEIDKFDPRYLYQNALEEIAMGDNNAQELAKTTLIYSKGQSESDSLQHLSEDYWFCRKIRQAGGQVWLCPWISLSHEGSFIYGGPFAHRPESTSNNLQDAYRLWI